MPSDAQLLGEALAERAAGPLDAARSATGLVRHPRRVLGGLAASAAGLGSLLASSIRPAPSSPYNVAIGPHRRFAWVRWDLPEVKAIKDELGGTVNDVMLTVVTLALGRHLHHRGVSTEGLELRAFIPVSVRDDSGRGDTGNQVAGMMAPLPVWAREPTVCFELISEAMTGLKQGGQAMGAKALTELSGFASPTIMSQAARLATRGRFFNLVVTNVPGPQLPLYLLGHEMIDFLPMVPLAPGQALGVAIMSYNGRIGFGLTGDWDALPDLDDLASDLRAAIDDLMDAAGVDGSKAHARGARTRS